MMTVDIAWGTFFSSLLPFGLPLLGGLTLLLVGPFWKRGHAFHFGFSLAVALASLVLAWRAWLKVSGGESATAGLFLFDAITYLFLIFFLVALILVLLLSRRYLEQFGIARFEYYALLLISVFGMGCMAAGHDLMVVFLGLEIMSVCLYVLTGFRRSFHFCTEAALKYFLMGAFASAFLLLGIAFLYGATGSTDLIVLNHLGMDLLKGDSAIYALLGMSFIGVGIAFKVAIVPFHFWAPDVYEGAPVVVTAFMATAVKAAAFAMLIRVVWGLFQWDPEGVRTFFWWGAVLTMSVGNVAALLQKNMKRMLAYSSVAHAGYALIPFVAFSLDSGSAVSSILFYLLAYLFMTVGAFAVLVALTEKDREAVEMEDLKGVGQRRPFLGFVMTVFLLSLAGLPPTVGFFGKYYLFIQAVNAGYVGLVVIAVLNSLVSVYYYLGPVVRMYFEGESRREEAAWLGQSVMAVLWLAVIAVLSFGLFPSTLLKLVQQTGLIIS